MTTKPAAGHPIEIASNTDYALMSDAEADALKGIVIMPHDIRRPTLERYLATHGPEALVHLFSQFIGMANSVVVNNRECIELLGIVKGGEHPDTAQKYNLPTIFGALHGVALANATDQRKMCPGCAYRLGTAANQSPVTTVDAKFSVKETVGEDRRYEFLCHERGLDAATGEPTKLCLGYRQMVRKAAGAASATESGRRA